MRRIFWVSLLVMITSVGAFAESVTYNVTLRNFVMVPNDGSGDNVGFTLAGPATNAIVIGGVPASFFSDISPAYGFAPGSVGGGTTSFFPDFVVSGYIGGYGPSLIEWNCCTPTLFVGAFTFPTNGQSVFTTTVPAALSGISATIVLPSGQTQQVFLNIKSFQLTLSFWYSAQDGVYYPSQATFSTTPEPATLVLMGTGLCAILGSFRRRRSA